MANHSQIPETTEPATVLQLAHEYAQLFAEYRRRSDYRPYSVRHRFDQMSDSDVEQALDAARERLATPAPSGRSQPRHAGPTTDGDSGGQG